MLPYKRPNRGQNEGKKMSGVNAINEINLLRKYLKSLKVLKSKGRTLFVVYV
jgi:hypothetical protein